MPFENCICMQMQCLCETLIMFCCKLYTELTVQFNQSAYSVDESVGSAHPALVLSNPSSTDITMQVFSIGRSATGE